MRKGILSFIFLMMFSGYCYAHPAQAINVNFRDGGVDVIVKHQVQDPKTHFIKEVIVELDGNEIIRQTNFMQTSPEELRLRYIIPGIEPGSKIKIKTSCNHGGDFEQESEF